MWNSINQLTVNKDNNQYHNVAILLNLCDKLSLKISEDISHFEYEKGWHTRLYIQMVFCASIFHLAYTPTYIDRIQYAQVATSYLCHVDKHCIT